MLQDDSTQGIINAEAVFNEQVKSGSKLYMAAGNYGLALAALMQKNPEKARQHLQEVRKVVGEKAATQSLALNSLAIETKLAAGQATEAVRDAREAVSRFPSSRALAYQYANAMFVARQYNDVVRYLRKQVQMYKEDATLRRQLAKVYDAQGKKALMHIAMAESYSLDGAYSAALEQLELARKCKDVTFYDQSVIDAYEREWKAIVKEEMKKR